MLSVPNAVASALAADTMNFAWLISLGDDLHFTNHAVDVMLAGKQFNSSGDLLRLPSIRREQRIKLQSVTIEFSNADGVMGFNLRNRYNPTSEAYEAYDRTGDLCEISLVFLDGAGEVIGDEAINLYRGAFDSWVERDDANTANASVKITSPWSKPNLTAGRITSDHNQKDNYPGDHFFEFAHEEKNTIGWGAEA